MGGLCFSHVLLAILIFQISIHTKADSTITTPPRDINTDYIKSSCNTTLYPKLCYRSLSCYASTIRTDPQLLTTTALNVTLTATKSTSRLIRRISKIHSLAPKEKGAIVDCVEEVGDSVDELRKSIGEMDSVAPWNFTAVMNDVQTWVSAAITNDDTCMDGCDEKAVSGDVKTIVRRHMLRIAHLTSIALVFVNSYASSQTFLS